MPPKQGWLGFLPLLLLGLAQSPAGASTSGFDDEVLPLLTRAGCNSGRCHGAATGQGGFKLSLFATDPSADHAAITREAESRRVDWSEPSRSLLLRKATGATAHGGGLRFDAASGDYSRIVGWLRAGAPRTPEASRIVTMRIEPALAYLKPGSSLPLKAFGTDAGGREVEVTHLVQWQSVDSGIATADARGIASAAAPGVTAIVARLRGVVAACRTAVTPHPGAPGRRGDGATANMVDSFIRQEAGRLGVEPPGAADDATFLRRVSLDLTGALPEAELHSRSLDRRAVIEELLESDRFTDYWTLQLADILLTDSRRLGQEGFAAYSSWLRSQVAAGTSLRSMVQQLLTSTGDGSSFGPANFYRRSSDPRDMAEFVGRNLLGIRLDCARCHNHPLDRWSQDDYYAFAGIFAPLRINQTHVSLAGAPGLPNPRSGEMVVPRLPGDSAQLPGLQPEELLAESARRLVAGPRPQPARLIVNRVWAALFGRGLVDPVDDLRPTNPEAAPGLLDALTSWFVASDWNLRGLIRLIAASDTYQAAPAVPADSQLRTQIFASRVPRLLTGPVLMDAISHVTGVSAPALRQAAVSRAVALLDPSVAPYTLQVFGSCRREEPGETGGGLPLVLHLLNDPGIEATVKEGAASLLTQHPESEAVVRELYLRALARPPTRVELDLGLEVLGPDPAAARVEDLLWAIMNTREFAFNR